MHVALEQPRVVDPRRHRHRPERPAGGVDAAVGGEAEGHAVALHVADLHLKLLRAPEVVGVEEGEEPPAAFADAGVARRRRAAPRRPAEEPDARLARPPAARRAPRLPSVEPSSTISISQSGSVCARTEATAAPSVAAAFQTGVTP